MIGTVGKLFSIPTFFFLPFLITDQSKLGLKLKKSFIRKKVEIISKYLFFWLHFSFILKLIKIQDRGKWIFKTD